MHSSNQIRPFNLIEIFFFSFLELDILVFQKLFLNYQNIYQLSALFKNTKNGKIFGECA